VTAATACDGPQPVVKQSKMRVRRQGPGESRVCNAQAEAKSSKKFFGSFFQKRTEKKALLF
jgi:hypothetical protein